MGQDFGSDLIAVAYGAGVYSTAMVIGLRDRRVPIDLILFADTGSDTWRVPAQGCAARTGLWRPLVLAEVEGRAPSAAACRRPSSG